MYNGQTFKKPTRRELLRRSMRLYGYSKADIASILKTFDTQGEAAALRRLEKESGRVQ